MSIATNAFEATILDTLVTGSYIGLISAVTDAEAGTVTELTGSGYARVATSGLFPAAVAGSALANDAAIEFPEATGAWLEATHVGIWDAATVGNLLAVIPLTVAKTVASGEVLRFAIGSLSLTAD